MTEDERHEAAYRKFQRMIESSRESERRAYPVSNSSLPASWKDFSGDLHLIDYANGVRVFCFDELKMPRVWMHGPKWRRLFDVKDDPIRAQSFNRKTCPTYTFEEDVRELVNIGRDELRPGVFAEW